MPPLLPISTESPHLGIPQDNPNAMHAIYKSNNDTFPVLNIIITLFPIPLTLILTTLSIVASVLSRHTTTTTTATTRSIGGRGVRVMSVTPTVVFMHVTGLTGRSRGIGVSLSTPVIRWWRGTTVIMCRRGILRRCRRVANTVSFMVSTRTRLTIGGIWGGIGITRAA